MNSSQAILLGLKLDIKEHKFGLQDALKARQKDISSAEAGAASAEEHRDTAETKLAAARAEYEKAVQRAKAAGVLTSIPAAESITPDEKR